jgi:V/A-type H+-transporting ATPase subunit K
MMKFMVLFVLAFLFLCAPVFAEEAGAAGEAANSNRGLIALGMGLAVGLGALGTGIAQARIGAAGLGGAVEKPESLGLALIFLLLPETLVIFGLVIAFILLGKL